MRRLILMTICCLSILCMSAQGRKAEIENLYSLCQQVQSLRDDIKNLENDRDSKEKELEQLKQTLSSLTGGDTSASPKQTEEENKDKTVDPQKETEKKKGVDHAKEVPNPDARNSDKPKEDARPAPAVQPPVPPREKQKGKGDMEPIKNKPMR